MLWAINRKIVSGKCLQESWHKSIRLVLPVGGKLKAKLTIEVVTVQGKCQRNVKYFWGS